MGCCCVLGCSHRSPKYHLFRFPPDSRLKDMWIRHINRSSWTPSKHDRVCNTHFEPSMFNRKGEGGRWLIKYNAIPTIFDQVKPRSVKSLRRGKAGVGFDPLTLVDEHSYSQPAPECPPTLWPETDFEADLSASDFEAPNLFPDSDPEAEIRDEAGPEEEDGDEVEPPPKMAEDPEPCVEMPDIVALSNSIPASFAPVSTTLMPLVGGTMKVTNIVAETDRLKRKVNGLVTLTRKWKDKFISVQKDRTAVKKKLRRVQKQLEKERTTNESLRRIFSADQLNYLKHGNGKGRAWSDDSMKKAIQLRLTCGGAGYKALLDQNYPLPSIRTLQGRTKGLKDEYGTWKENTFRSAVQRGSTTTPQDESVPTENVQSVSIPVENVHNYLAGRLVLRPARVVCGTSCGRAAQGRKLAISFFFFFFPFPRSPSPVILKGTVLMNGKIFDPELDRGALKGGLLREL
eukprot:maker-scaffold100_size373717-snap-gene-2.42 protein:Tk05137 transcript:maker-scaffold100_size373717-snap-gene-2.42-mRNA-1 annotation:"PREDICTED: uncharacterized protein LOC755078"